MRTPPSVMPRDREAGRLTTPWRAALRLLQRLRAAQRRLDRETLAVQLGDLGAHAPRRPR